LRLRRNESVPSKSRSDTVCTSLIGGRTEVTYVVISWKLRCDQYGSLCGWRLSCRQIPAYAMIDDPEPGSTEFAAFRFPPEQLNWLPLKVWLPAN
jgi:hypothetical protein